MKDKQIFGLVEKIVDAEQRRIRFVISTDEVDRDGERVEVAAVAAAIPAFAANPTCLACHQHRLADGASPVIGSWDTDSFKALKHRSEMDLVFATTPLGEQYWTLYRDQHMRAVSIGFQIVDDHEELINNTPIRVISKIALYEISCVPVGANRQALAKYAALREAAPETDAQATADVVAERVQTTIDEKLAELRDTLTAELGEIKDILCADSGQLAAELLGVPAESVAAGGAPPTETGPEVIDTLAALAAEVTRRNHPTERTPHG